MRMPSGHQVQSAVDIIVTLLGMRERNEAVLHIVLYQINLFVCCLFKPNRLELVYNIFFLKASTCYKSWQELFLLDILISFEWMLDDISRICEYKKACGNSD